jgi:hypothetical protein
MADLSPAEIAEAKAEARRLRRQRQTTKNLVGSILATLAIVVFLILVVARPSESFRDTINYQAVANELSANASSPLAAPMLDPTWSANRADIRDEQSGQVWTLGLISSSGDFVKITQYLGTVEEVSALVPPGGVDYRENISGTRNYPLEWTIRDRSRSENPGNDVIIAWRDTPSGALVVSGTSKPGVLVVIAALHDSQQELFEEAK